MTTASIRGAALAGALLVLGTACSPFGGESDSEPTTTAEAISTGWTRIESPALRVADRGGPRGAAGINAVAAVPSGFVAVGEANGRAAVWISADGETWRRPARGQAAFRTRHERLVMTGVAARPRGRLVAVGFEQAASGRSWAVVWTSSDGRRWARQPDQDGFRGNGSTSLRAVAASRQGFVAVGLRGYATGSDAGRAGVWTSRNGRTWRLASPRAKALRITGAEGMTAVLAHPGGLLAIGADGMRPAAWASRNGSSWSRLRQEGFPEGRRYQVTGLADAGATLVVAGYDRRAEQGMAWISTDGTTWSAHPLEGGENGLPFAAAGAGDDVVVVGQRNAAGDLDGAVWRLTVAPEVRSALAPDDVFGGDGTQEIAAVALGEGRIVAAGRDHGPGEQPAVWTAPLVHPR